MSEAKRFDDLSPKTKEFLSNLREDEVDSLRNGIRLITAALTVGVFVKWLIVCMVGILFGFVMVGESVVKIAAWMRGW